MPSLSYHPIQKALHWAIFLLVLACYGLTYGGLFFAKGDPGRALAWWAHISLGLLLAALLAARIAARLALGAPPLLPVTTSAFEALVAKVTHLLLYGLMIAIVGLGVLLAWLRADAVTFFGLFIIPAPIAPDAALAHLVKDAHELCADAILATAGVHALAALWHHYVRRDDVLSRMLPGR